MFGFLYLLLLGVPALLGVRRKLLRLRKGDEPRCGRCEYNLTGLPGDRCPECGGLFQEVGVQKGTFVLSEGARRVVGVGILAVVSAGVGTWILLMLVFLGVLPLS